MQNYPKVLVILDYGASGRRTTEVPQFKVLILHNQNLIIKKQIKKKQYKIKYDVSQKMYKYLNRSNWRYKIVVTPSTMYGPSIPLYKNMTLKFLSFGLWT